MALGSNNPFPSALFVEGTTPSSPSVGQQRLFVRSSDHILCTVNSSGTVVPLDPMTTRGDLIVRNASNVTARLAVGAANTVLASDGTDVSWGGGTYAAWVPALTATVSNPTLGSGSSATGRYTQIGKHVSGVGNITFGSSGVNPGSGSYRVSLPVTCTSGGSDPMGWVTLYDSSASLIYVANLAYVSTTTVQLLTNASVGGIVVGNGNPWTWAASDAIVCHFDYEAA